MGIEDRQYVQRKFNPGIKHRNKSNNNGKLIVGFFGVILIVILLIQWLS